ncbi:SDR family oxidoreductase [Saccharopolyspora sp. 6V]|uniref:SDR family oxidoreductase n=1 Tax=Saccharopolyspora sp. 6V TaxID=2877239 RepID=UPI001CD7F5E1|nr:SDR family oxidoreductase [Saccharopolyspora sp. 6V]MCA1191963.1 SDR family oxidoreductase [Saccharopolyspora sp. 6V]
MRRTPAGMIIAVTGGARGIGREIARTLAAAGARVAIGDRDLAAAERTAAELPGELAAFPADVTDTGSFAAFLDAVADRWGPIDVLVNNAGVMWVGPFDEEPESAVRRQLEVNVHGVIRGVRLAAPRMRERGRGQIVTIASGASKFAPPGEATYAATKHAVHGYLDAVRAELHGTGVRLSLVLPGVVDTELAAGTATGPVRRLAPAKVGRAVLRIVRRPRFELSVPRRLGFATWLARVLPDPARYRLQRVLVPNQVAAVTGGTTRSAYEDRALTGTDEETR